MHFTKNLKQSYINKICDTIYWKNKEFQTQFPKNIYFLQQNYVNSKHFSNTISYRVNIFNERNFLKNKTIPCKNNMLQYKFHKKRILHQTSSKKCHLKKVI